MTIRRTRRSAQQWAELITQFQASQESQQVFCERLGLALTTFQKYVRRQANALHDGPRAKSTAFVDVTPPRSPAPMSTTITLHAGPNLRMECPLSMGVATLAQLVREVRDGR